MEWLSFIRNIRNLLVCSCWASSRKHVKETTRAIYARAYTRPYQKMGIGKLKRNRNTYGIRMEWSVSFIARSITVQYPFAARFFKPAPVVRIERVNFFYAYRICIWTPCFGERQSWCRCGECALIVSAILVPMWGMCTNCIGNLGADVGNVH